MPIVDYFDEATQSRKKKDFGYGAMGKENSRIFMEKQKESAKLSGAAPPKMTTNVMEGERHTDSMRGSGPGVGAKPKESPKEKEKRHQAHDQKEIDKNKPSEKKTKKPEKEVKYVKLNEDDRYHKKIGARSGLDHGHIPGY